MDEVIRVSDEVAAALRERRPVVALETSVVAQGLPPPANLESARRCAAAVREGGAIPAAIGVLAGRIIVGLSDDELARLGDPARKPAKAGARDLAGLCAQQRDAGTTVSATCAIAERAGIRVFATGGIGGVHRRLDALEPADISADLPEIARRRVCVVCAGPKFILDVPATFEFLETLGVPVWSFKSDELPAFYCGSGLRAEQAFNDAASVARALRVHWDALASPTGVLLAVPPPIALDRATIESALAPALREAAARQLPGKEITPFLLASLSKATAGRTQEANLALLENNARVAGARRPFRDGPDQLFQRSARDRSRAQETRRSVEREHGRLNPHRAAAAVEHGVDAPIEIAQHVRRGSGRNVLGPIRARSRQRRSHPLEQRPRRRVRGRAYPDRLSARGALPRFERPVGDERPRLVLAEHVHDDRIGGRPPLGRIDRAHCQRLERERAQAVDGLGGKRDQPSAAQEHRGLVEIGRRVCAEEPRLQCSASGPRPSPAKPAPSLTAWSPAPLCGCPRRPAAESPRSTQGATRRRALPAGPRRSQLRWRRAEPEGRSTR